MTETKSVGRTTAVTTKSLHGDDFYVRIGRLGGKRGTTGGFASKQVDANGMTGRDRARIHGVVGGRKSRRPSKKVTPAPVAQRKPANENFRMDWRQRLAALRAGRRKEVI